MIYDLKLLIGKYVVLLSFRCLQTEIMELKFKFIELILRDYMKYKFEYSMNNKQRHQRTLHISILN